MWGGLVSSRASMLCIHMQYEQTKIDNSVLISHMRGTEEETGKFMIHVIACLGEEFLIHMQRSWGITKYKKIEV